MIKNGIKKAILFVSIGLCVGVVGCRRQGDKQGAAASLEAFQIDLLNLAFDTASAIPLEPHVKDRARMQELVVTACLTLDQDDLADTYLSGIPNWRAGMGYANLAFKKVQSGATLAQVEAYLIKAMEAAEQAEGWRKDRIKARVAQVQAFLGRDQAAAALEQGIEAMAETGALDRIEAMHCGAEDFQRQVDALQTRVDIGHFDIVNNALQAYAELFNRFYGDVERRDLIEEKIKAAWSKHPFTVRVDLLCRMAEAALAHQDEARTLAWVNEAKAMTEQVDWAPRFLIPQVARLSQLRFRAGDRAQATQEIRTALALFEARQAGIVNIDRAGILRPLAETCQVMGDSAQALTIYKRGVEAGVENPNARPRAEDLVGTCCSMAVSGAEPDADLWQRLHQIHDGLGAPW
ncbi:MAG: hypothetical protein HQ515_11370 [Phycisphaeraceae bacterium]|nr:hypothetical protein [Phycisphaeraceae bacterium]